MSEEVLDGEVDLDEEIIELIDDNENIIKFRFLDVTEYKGERYALLLAAEPNDVVEEDEVVISRLNEAGDAFEPIEDDNLLQEVFDFYQSEAEEEN